MANRFNINEAYPGFCSLCHDEIAEFDGFIQACPGVMRPRIIKLKPNFRQVNVLLSDDSVMSVSLCEKCEDFEPEDAGKLIESEVRGWERECRELLDMKPEHEEYLKRQSRIEVLDREDKRWAGKDLTKIGKPDKAKMGLPEHILKEK